MNGKPRGPGGSLEFRLTILNQVNAHLSSNKFIRFKYFCEAKCNNFAPDDTAKQN